MTGKWLATRIESSAGNGVPDVTFTVPGKHGWMELKYIKEWPKRITTKVKLPLRPEQRLWINTRGQVANNIWVLCRIENSFYLLNHRTADEACEGYNRVEWDKLCDMYWGDRIDFKQLYRILLNGGV